jgi:putative FmdB family regulatory protein
MPIYLFRCAGCGAQNEHLLPLGETADRRCPSCGEMSKHRFARVGVRFNDWGFGATDNLVADSRGKDFKALRETAEKIADE